jgi:amidase
LYGVGEKRCLVRGENVRVIPRDRVILSFDREIPHAYEVEQGEIFWVETDDCYGGQIEDELVRNRNSIDPSIIDLSVGPIAVKGAMPGDTLRVDVIDIELGARGVMVTMPGMGVIGDKITSTRTSIIHVKDGFARFSDDIVLPVAPMVGIVGVAPAGESVRCEVPGDHGANMDARVIGEGASVYLPVAVEGAGLAIGDLHALMGDGELSGSGIEIAGRVRLRATVIKRALTGRPVVETEDCIYTIANAEDIESAISIAARDMVGILAVKKGLGFEEAYRLLGAVCDAQICQVVNNLKTVRVRAPKATLGIDSPF